MRVDYYPERRIRKVATGMDYISDFSTGVLLRTVGGEEVGRVRVRGNRDNSIGEFRVEVGGKSGNYSRSSTFSSDSEKCVTLGLILSH